MKITPLEKALEIKTLQSETPCEGCENLIPVKDALYCADSGKLIMPEHMPNWVNKCYGARKDKPHE